MTPILKHLTAENLKSPLTPLTTLGSDSLCTIQLSGLNIEPRHCRIEQKSEDTWILRDLRTSSGTFLNSARILEAQLQDGDLIAIGNLEFIFQTQETRETPFPLSSKNTAWHSELQSLTHVSKTDFPVLILGPSGTGKDVVANSIHDESFRKSGPFISVNCSALSETLIESELFGHIKGSFTGAISDRKGAFEAARGGTLFLDEIGDLSYSLQAKLLRALENNEIRPVGADRNIKTDVRIIAATHQHLTSKIREGAFRSDLYFRLNVINITPPALVDRMEDFETLLYIFAKKMRVRFSFNAIARLKKHSWPGNIRELKNLVTRASAIFPKEYINEEHVEKLIDRTLCEPSTAQSSIANIPVIKEIEKQMILKRLEANRGNQRRTANDLGMPKSTLHDRLKFYNINPAQFKV